MAKKQSRRKLKRQNKWYLYAVVLAGIAVVTLVAAQIVVQMSNARDIPADRDMTILSLPQATEAADSPAFAAVADPLAAVLPEATAAPTPEPTAVPTPEPTAAPASEPFEYLPVVKKAQTTEKKIAITVDDCFQVNNLARICSTADKYGGRLTLFPIGENLSKAGMSDLLKLAVSKGFQIENHTWSHARVFRLSDEEMAAEIWKQRNALNQALGVNYQQSFFRLMGGDGEYDQRTHSYLKQLGFRGIADWTLSGSDADMSLINSTLAPGVIYLFHTTDADTAKLEEFIPYAASQGYELVTLNELLGYPANTWTDLSTAETSMPQPQAYTVEYREQKNGDYSWAVVKIQAKLEELGYLRATSSHAVIGQCADGVYGESTASAVAAFQASVGLPATGVADVDTQSALLGGA
ncbi:MAG: polysaccharide deacetylase family protein [Candidatus Faecivicinus sp.]